MNHSFKGFSFRAKPLNYDALASMIGCQSIDPEADIFGLKSFIRVCTVAATDNELFTIDPRIGYCLGPTVTPGPTPFFEGWFAWVASSGVRVGRVPDVTLPANDIGDISSLFPTSKGNAISIAFDIQGLMCIALENNQEIQIRRFSDTDGTITAATPFFGASPQLAFLGNAFVGELDEIACIYIRPDSSRALFARLQRDNFATEYTLNASLPITPMALKQVFSENGIMTMLAVSTDGRYATFYSPKYSSDAGHDSSTTGAKLDVITYYQSSVPAAAIFDSSKMAISLDKIVYADTIVSASALTGDEAMSNVSLDSIDYI